MDQTYYKVLNQLLTENNINRISYDEIKKIKRIGRGSQSSVYSAEYKNMIVAVKELTEFDIKCIIHEIAILSRLVSDHLPKFIGVVLDETRENLSYVTSYITGKPLDEIDVNKLSDDIKIKITQQLSKIVTYIHENNCVHRDLKAENVMLDNDFKVYLIDFGISKVLNPDNTIETRAKGTMNYLAPEILDVSTLNDKGQIISVITTGVDVWAFCCLVSYIFSGFIPWTTKVKPGKSTQIQVYLTKKMEFPIPSNIQQIEILDIIRSGTIIDLSQRKNMKEINEMVQNLKPIKYI
jgi:serine/threonine protein kinase